MLVFETKLCTQCYIERLYSLRFEVECISSNICETCDTCMYIYVILFAKVFHIYLGYILHKHISSYKLHVLICRTYSSHLVFECIKYAYPRTNFNNFIYFLLSTRVHIRERVHSFRFSVYYLDEK